MASLLGVDVDWFAQKEGWRVYTTQNSPLYGFVSYNQKVLWVTRLGQRSWRMNNGVSTFAFGSQYDLQHAMMREFGYEEDD